MGFLRYLVFSGILLISSLASASEMMSCKNMAEVHGKILALLDAYKPEEILVLSDIDMTLTQPEAPEAQYPAFIQYHGEYKRLFQNESPEVKDLAMMDAVLSGPQILVEKESPGIMRDLQQRGLHIIAFTASLSGEVFSIKRFEVFRQENLKNLGFDFENALDQKEIIFDAIPAYRGYRPIYYKGVLCSNPNKGAPSKGITVNAFLAKTGLRPKIIVMIDDMKKNLDDIAAHLKSYPSVRFIGMEYKGAMGGESKITLQRFQSFWQEGIKAAKDYLATCKTCFE